MGKNIAIPSAFVLDPEDFGHSREELLRYPDLCEDFVDDSFQIQKDYVEELEVYKDGKVLVVLKESYLNEYIHEDWFHLLSSTAKERL